MNAVHKYPIPLGRSSVSMPRGARILTAQYQPQSGPCIWAEVDPTQPREMREIVVYGTGHALADGRRAYIATFQMHGGDLVWHVFDETPAGAPP